MKKLLSLMLALCMLCGAVAFADKYNAAQEVEVTLMLDVGYDGEFEVEIPTQVTFGSAQEDESGNNYYEAEAAVKVNKNETEQTVVIYIGDRENNVLYNEYSDEIGFDISATASGEKATIAEEDNIYAGLCVDNAGSGEFNLTFTTEAKPADELIGTYTHTRTFRIVLE